MVAKRVNVMMTAELDPLCSFIACNKFGMGMFDTYVDTIFC